MASLLPPGEAPTGVGGGATLDQYLSVREQFIKTYTPFNSLQAYLDFESSLPRQNKSF